MKRPGRSAKPEIAHKFNKLSRFFTIWEPLSDHPNRQEGRNTGTDGACSGGSTCCRKKDLSDFSDNLRLKKTTARTSRHAIFAACPFRGARLPSKPVEHEETCNCPAGGGNGDSCQVDYHPYDTRIDGECGINAKNIARIEASTAGKSAIRFAVISDTQRWYDETREAVSALNARGDIDFVLHTGDMADFGMKAEFERQRDILNRLHVPYVVLLGNHDCLATGEEIFRTIFGDFNTAFTAGNVRILCLNTNALEFDLREAVPNFEFIETELTEFPPEASKTIVAMHAKPYTEQFGDNVAKGFQYLVTRFPGLQCCINGHGHNYKVVDLFGDGVLYHECDNIAKRSYLLFSVNDEGYACERIEF